MVLYTDMYEEFGFERIKTLAYDRYYTGTEISSGTLDVGFRYEFSNAGTSPDFSNVGFSGTVAIGEYFYATGTTPTAWDGAVVYIGQSQENIINTALITARSQFESIASFTGNTFSEENEVATALMYYTLYILYARNQKYEEGEDEKKVAYEILVQQWGQSVRIFLEGGSNNNESFDIVRQAGVVVENADHATYDEIDVDDQ